MTWADLTIYQYQRITELLANATDEVSVSEAEEQILVEIGGYTAEELQEMPLLEFEKLFNKEFGFLSTQIPQSKPRKVFKAGWRLYRINYNITDLTKGTYDEVIGFSSKGIVENLHYLMASITKPIWCFPKDEHKDRAKRMQKAPFLVAYSCAVFFCQMSKNLFSNILTSLETQTWGMTQSQLDQLRESLRTLISTMDGCTTTNELQTSTISN